MVYLSKATKTRVIRALKYRLKTRYKRLNLFNSIPYIYYRNRGNTTIPILKRVDLIVKLSLFNK